MRKHIAILLSAAMLLGSFSTAFAEEVTEATAEEIATFSEEEFPLTILAQEDEEDPLSAHADAAENPAENSDETSAGNITGTASLELFIAGDLPTADYMLDEDEVPALGDCDGPEDVYSLVQRALDETADAIEKGTVTATGNAITIDVSALEIPDAEDEIAELSKVISSVINDRTDIFYLDNSFSYDTYDGIITSVGLIFTDEWVAEDGTPDASALCAAVSTAAEGKKMMMADVADGMSDLEKAFAVHERMVEEIDYDMYHYTKGNIPNADYTANGIYTNRYGVCQGYAEAYKDIMGDLGIECKLVTSSEVNHAWNLIKIDGSWYHVDVTWDDPYTDPETNYNDNHAWTYFLLADSELKGHGSDWVGTVPSASTTTEDKSYLFRTCQSEYGNGYMVYKDGYWNTAIYKYASNKKYVLRAKIDGSDESTVSIPTASTSTWSSQDTGRIIGNKVYFMETAGRDKTAGTLLFNVSSYSITDGSKISQVVTSTATKNVSGLSIKNGILNYTVEDTSSGSSVYSRVAIEEAQENNISFAKSEVTLYDTEPYDLGLTVTPENLEIELASSDTSVAIITGKGIVTPVASGQAIITATAVIDTSESISATCIVNVELPVEQTPEYEPDIDPENPLTLEFTDGTYKTLGLVPLPDSLGGKYEWVYPATKLNAYAGTTSWFAYALKDEYRAAGKYYENHLAQITINYAENKAPKAVKNKVLTTVKTYKPTVVMTNKSATIYVDGNGVYKTALYIHEKMGNMLNVTNVNMSTKMADLDGGCDYDPETGRLEFYFKNPGTGKAVFTITPRSCGTDLKTVKFTVNFKTPVTKKASNGKKAVVITTKPLGNVDLLSQSNTPVYCTVTNPSTSKIVAVELSGQDGPRFEVTKVDRNIDGEIAAYAVTAKDVDLRNKTSYKVTPVYTFADGTSVEGKAFNIKTAQSSVKTSIVADSSVIDSSNGQITLTIYGTWISGVSAEASIVEAPEFEVKTVNSGNNVQLIIKPTNTNTLAPGTYTLSGFAAFDNTGKNVGNTAITYKFTVAE